MTGLTVFLLNMYFAVSFVMVLRILATAYTTEKVQASASQILLWPLLLFTAKGREKIKHLLGKEE